MGLTARPGASPELPKPPREPAERRAWLGAQLDAAFKTPCAGQGQDLGDRRGGGQRQDALRARRQDGAQRRVQRQDRHLRGVAVAARPRVPLAHDAGGGRSPERPAAPRRWRGERRSLSARLRRSDAVDRRPGGDGERSGVARPAQDPRLAGDRRQPVRRRLRPAGLRSEERLDPPRARRRRRPRSTETSSASPSSPRRRRGAGAHRDRAGLALLHRRRTGDHRAERPGDPERRHQGRRQPDARQRRGAHQAGRGSAHDSTGGSRSPRCFLGQTLRQLLERRGDLRGVACASAPRPRRGCA